ncbi:hypothetical protein GCM10007937_29190 [Mesorhizobium albiziae]|nr:hypothetical protein GCM10007937_29190 [Mesorhizobium albiziae]
MLKRDMEPLPAQQLAAQSAGSTQLPCRLFCQHRGGRIGPNAQENPFGEFGTTPCIRIVVIKVKAELIVHDADTSQYA